MDAKEALSEIRQRLAEAAERTGEASDLAKGLVPLISVVEKALGGPNGFARPSQGPEGQIAYRVEKSALGETLAEYRPGGKPLRCPKSIYEAVTAVLADSNAPSSASEVVKAVDRMIGGSPGEFQIRVVLRFWMAVEPPLLVRVRARYRAASPKELQSQADRLWHHLQA